MPSTVWVDAIGKARMDLTFAGYTSYFLWSIVPSLREALRVKAEGGARVRFLLGDPESEVTRRREAEEAVSLTISSRIAITMGELEHLKGLPNVEARYSDRHIALSVWQFDDEAVVCTHIASLVDSQQPGARRVGDRLGSPSCLRLLRWRGEAGVLDLPCLPGHGRRSGCFGGVDRGRLVHPR
ncbi:hypothetical protein GCM10009839_05910 [Catenulispora yoronensis]|uniref:Uncharacterized protein n=1 Tax=Catenulispora yoronensis TaxID=450799 RepID=A0ABN2TM51_9ACTN